MFLEVKIVEDTHFKDNQEVVIALSGAFDVVVDDGERQKKFELNRSYYGQYIPAGLWRTMENFSTNSFAQRLGAINHCCIRFIYCDVR